MTNKRGFIPPTPRNLPCAPLHPFQIIHHAWNVEIRAGHRVPLLRVVLSHSVHSSVHSIRPFDPSIHSCIRSTSVEALRLTEERMHYRHALGDTAREQNPVGSPGALPPLLDVVEGLCSLLDPALPPRDDEDVHPSFTSTTNHICKPSYTRLILSFSLDTRV